MMKNRLKIDKLILVEGKYDKIRLENIVDADIFVLNGFSIFKNKNAVNTIKALAGEREVLLLTDSDGAGYKIRVYLSKVLSANKIVNVFLPQIKGKEKRKLSPSAEGFLGVEGISDEIIFKALEEYSFDAKVKGNMTFSDLFELGYSGCSGASEKKNALLKYLGVQSNISKNLLLKILNQRYTLEEFKIIDKNIQEGIWQ